MVRYTYLAGGMRIGAGMHDPLPAQPCFLVFACQMLIYEIHEPFLRPCELRPQTLRDRLPLYEHGIW
jgi:hypothetical protein